MLDVQAIETSSERPPDVTNTMLQALQKVKGDEGIKVAKDEYDADHDQVLRNTSITKGLMAFSSYFPKNESVLAITRSMGHRGWKLAACPMFGGTGASWPTFVWHHTGKPMWPSKLRAIPEGLCWWCGGASWR